MKRQRVLAATAAGALATTFALAFSSGTASADPLERKADEARAELLGTASPAMIEEMTETFGISATEAYDRLAVEAVASELLTEVPETYETYAGLWVSDDAEEILVATTSEADAADLEAEGATPVLVEHDLDELEAAAAELDAVEAEGVYGHFVDVESNSVVIEAADDAAATGLAEAAGVDPELITVDTTAEAPETYFVRGGDAYLINNASRCSVGFAVRQGSTPGFVTAGHCGGTGADVTGGEAAPGVFRASVFPGEDRAWVEVGSGEQLQNVVNMYSGSRTVSDANQAAPGASICRSGSTTGWHCGTVEALNQTVYYAEGTVYGLTRTDVCAEPGDSGGSFISGNSAQGMTSGGSGDCTSGGTTYFQPIGPALSDWGLTLVTS
ncbi:S1 family peptidase, partial [Glycomyces tenuis]|uniref:S1 family peptidase n=1 Tax=Glycomyces tenuis TaxID=58116 RepID=UPI0005548510